MSLLSLLINLMINFFLSFFLSFLKKQLADIKLFGSVYQLLAAYIVLHLLDRFVSKYCLLIGRQTFTSTKAVRNVSSPIFKAPPFLVFL